MPGQHSIPMDDRIRKEIEKARGTNSDSSTPEQRKQQTENIAREIEKAREAYGGIEHVGDFPDIETCDIWTGVNPETKKENIANG